MAYYKNRLTTNEDNPPVHAGDVLTFDHARGRGTIKQINTGTVYPFRDVDLLTFEVYEGSRVLFSISKNGTAFNIARIINSKKN